MWISICGKLETQSYQLLKFKSVFCQILKPSFSIGYRDFSSLQLLKLINIEHYVETILSHRRIFLKHVMHTF